MYGSLQSGRSTTSARSPSTSRRSTALRRSIEAARGPTPAHRRHRRRCQSRRGGTRSHARRRATSQRWPSVLMSTSHRASSTRRRCAPHTAKPTPRSVTPAASRCAAGLVVGPTCRDDQAPCDCPQCTADHAVHKTATSHPYRHGHCSCCLCERLHTSTCQQLPGHKISTGNAPFGYAYMS